MTPLKIVVRAAADGDAALIAFGFELAEELEYSHANRSEPPPAVMRRQLRR
jgi:hypothetical protein